MKDLKKIVGYNLLVLILFVVVVRIFGITPTDELDESNRQYGNLGAYILTAIFVLADFIINLVISIVYFSTKNKTLGRAYLLSSFLVLLIGFSSCVTILNA